MFLVFRYGFAPFLPFLPFDPFLPLAPWVVSQVRPVFGSGSPDALGASRLPGPDGYGFCKELRLSTGQAQRAGRFWPGVTERNPRMPAP